MQVVSIEVLTKTKRRILFDNDVHWVMKASDLDCLKLQEGIELSDDDYEQLYDTYVLKAAKKKALSLLEKSDYTRKDLENRLYGDGFPTEAVNGAMDYVSGYRYIDDERYTRNYLDYRSGGKSRQLIYQTLASKGIDSDTIENCMEDMDFDDVSTIRQMCMKKFGNMEEFTPEKKKKVFNYFLRRGFRYSDIADVLKEFDSI